MILTINQDSIIETNFENLEALLMEALAAIRKHKTDDESESFHLLISSYESGEEGHSEIGIDKLSDKSPNKVRIYTVPID